MSRGFLGLLGMKKHRIIRLVKKNNETGLPPAETTGGDRVKTQNGAKKESIKNVLNLSNILKAIIAAVILLIEFTCRANEI